RLPDGDACRFLDEWNDDFGRVVCRSVRLHCTIPSKILNGMFSAVFPYSGKTPKIPAHEEASRSVPDPRIDVMRDSRERRPCIAGSIEPDAESRD
ncbi:MAG: hypothetical protein ABW026_09065, partial [Microvirga sp.]